MKQPVISVIIPFYNEEDYLQRAINSVVNQTYLSIQIILVDDGSTDNSTLIAKEFRESHPNCKLIIIANSGPGNARNVGIENATGTYISFLDADDFYHPTAIELFYKNSIESEADLCICQFTMLDKNENVIKSSNWNTSSIFDYKTAILFVVSEQLIPTSWGKLFKTKIAKKCSFPNLSWKEDDVFFLSYLLECKTVKVVNKPLITINCRPDSLTRQKISKKMISAICKSYNLQFELLHSLNDMVINRALIEGEINTFLNLLILLKLDWKKIENQKQIWKYYNEKVIVLSKKPKDFKLNFKKRLLLIFLKSSTILGWRYSFWVISIFKRSQLNHLKSVKS